MDTIKKWMEESIVDEIILMVILIVIVEAIAQNTIKQSNNKSINLMIGLLAYMLVGYLLHYAYHKFPFSKINVMWSALSIILAGIFGYMLYDEPLTIKFNLAILFAVLAIYLAYDS